MPLAKRLLGLLQAKISAISVEPAAIEAGLGSED